MHLDWWTLGFQAVNFLVLAWLLGRFLFRPVAAIIAERQTAAARLLAEADARRAEIAAARVEIARTREAFAAERAVMLAKAEQEAEQAKKSLLAGIEAEIAEQRRSAATALDRERDSFEKQLLERAGRLAIDIAAQLVARIGQGEANGLFLARLAADLARLPEEEREALSRGPAELASAVPLNESEQVRCRATIAQALGRAQPLSFRVDPDLLAGFELGGRNFVLRDSWRADLARILTGLDHDRFARQ